MLGPIFVFELHQSCNYERILRHNIFLFPVPKFLLFSYFRAVSALNFSVGACHQLFRTVNDFCSGQVRIRLQT